MDKSTSDETKAKITNLRISLGQAFYRIKELERVVKAVAKSDPFVYAGGSYDCMFCDEDSAYGHADDCEWLLARRLMENGNEA